MGQIEADISTVNDSTLIKELCKRIGLEELITEAVKNAMGGQSANDTDVYAPVEKPLNVKELCAFLNIAEPTLLRWRKRSKIPFMQIGSRLLFDKAAVLKALETKSNSSAEKIKFMSGLNRGDKISDEIKLKKILSELKRLGLDINEESILLMGEKLDLIRKKRFENFLKENNIKP